MRSNAPRGAGRDCDLEYGIPGMGAVVPVGDEERTPIGPIPSATLRKEETREKISPAPEGHSDCSDCRCGAMDGAVAASPSEQSDCPSALQETVPENRALRSGSGGNRTHRVFFPSPLSAFGVAPAESGDASTERATCWCCRWGSRGRSFNSRAHGARDVAGHVTAPPSRLHLFSAIPARSFRTSVFLRRQHHGLGVHALPGLEHLAPPHAVPALLAPAHGRHRPPRPVHVHDRLDEHVLATYPAIQLVRALIPPCLSWERW